MSWTEAVIFFQENKKKRKKERKRKTLKDAGWKMSTSKYSLQGVSIDEIYGQMEKKDISICYPQKHVKHHD